MPQTGSYHHLQLLTDKLRYSVKQGEHILPILRDVDFCAHSGEFVGIVGPNGAGKTTLLKALAGFITIQGNLKLSCDGAAYRSWQSFSLKERARQVCYMHQDTSVPFAFTVREVVALGRQPWLGRFSSASNADRQTVDNALQLTGCHQLAERCIQDLSGGERQRVMLARAVAQQTPILLLDEPTASLDIRYAHNVFALCRELAAQGRCVIAVLHDLRQAACVCDRLYLMHEGTVVADGEPTHVLSVDNMIQAYGVHTKVFDNPAGQWDYYIDE